MNSVNHASTALPEDPSANNSSQDNNSNETLGSMANEVAPSISETPNSVKKMGLSGFECLDGHTVHTKEELARELFDNAEQYLPQLNTPAHPVWVFLRQIGQGDLADKYPDIIRTRKIDGVRSLCYDLSRSIPYIFTDSQGNSFPIHSRAELQKYLRDNIINQNNINILASPSFRVWLAQQDPEVINRLGDKINSNDSASKIGWITAYLTSPNLDYNFKEIQRLDKSDCFTLEQLCQKIVQQISNPTRYGSDLASQWQTSYFDSSRLCQYLLSKDKYDNQVQYIRQQLGVTGIETTPHYGHYNKRLQKMKAVAGLLGGKFPLEIKNKVISDLKDFEANKNAFQTLSPTEDELLTDWLTLSFSEDPMVDYNRKPYQGLVKDMINYMVTNCPDSKVATKVKSYRKKIDDARKTYKKTALGIKLLQWSAILLCFVPMLAIFCTSIYVMLTADKQLFCDFMESIGTIAGWVIGILIGIWAITESGFVSGIVIGFLAGWGTKVLCDWEAPMVPWVWVALLAVILIIFAKKLFKKIQVPLTDKWSSLPMSQADTLAEMSEAFGQRNRLLPNLPSDYPICVYNTAITQNKVKAKKLLNSTLMMFIVTLGVIGLSVYVNNSYRHFVDGDRTEITVVPGQVAGYYEGIVNGTHATLVLIQTDTPETTILKGKLITDYGTILEHNLVGRFSSMDKKNMVLNVVNQDGKGDDMRQYITAIDYDDDGTITLSGNYENQRKKTSHSFIFKKKE